ncbi:MAG: hypothetical protein Q7T55_21020 [Solirubrobacteraceae bacterium]|nr:hypothetical protein [Solirubrobacteraceae bacterium]
MLVPNAWVMVADAARPKLLFVAAVAAVLSAVQLLTAMLAFGALNADLYVRLLTVVFPTIALALTGAALTEARRGRIQRGTALIAAWVVVMVADWYLPVSRAFLGT